MGIQIAIVVCDNWEGLYVNDMLVYEDHEITIPILMPYVLYQHVDKFEQFFADDKQLEETGRFPVNLPDVMLEGGRTVAETWESE